MSEIDRSAVLAAKRTLTAFVDWYEEKYSDDPETAQADPELARIAKEATRVLDALECDNELIE